MLIDYQVPERTALPEPNAFDFYCRAADSIVCSQQIAEAIGNTSPKAEIPNIKFAPRFKFMDTPQESGKIEVPPPGVPAPQSLDRLYNTEEKQAVVDANRKALELLKEGINYECMLPKDIADFERQTNFRKLAQLIRLQGMLYQDAGDYGKAAICLLEGLKFGSDSVKGGILISDLVSTAIQAITRKHLWELIDNLSIDNTKQAVLITEKVVDNNTSFESVIKEECYSGLAHARDMLNSSDWRWRLAEFYSMIIPDEKISFMDRLLFYWSYLKTFSISPKKLFIEYKQDCNKLIEAAGLPYYKSVNQYIRIRNIFSVTTVPPIGPGRFKHEYNRCMNELLLLQLALHLYKLEHNCYPKSLEDLVPEYISKLPNDPFSDNQSYKYRLTEDKYILYSIGPDMIDDNGRAIEKSSKKLTFKDDNGKEFEINSLKSVRHDDKGDIVAGINT